jgi:glycosyltransferase involved in cell wall biosynthesis
MRILIVSAYFPPFNAIGAIRVGKFAKFLAEAGHDVRVISAEDSNLDQSLNVEIPKEKIIYTDWIDPQTIFLKLFRRKNQSANFVADRTRSKWANFVTNWVRALCYWPDRHAFWSYSAMKAGRELCFNWRPDLIYASAWPITSLTIAKWLSTEFKVPWVAELRDLWTGNHYYQMPFWRQWVDRIWERRLLQSASLLVTVSDPLAATLRKRFQKPVVTVLNGFDPQDFPNQASGASSEDLIISYTGTIYPGKRDPTPLLQALSLLGSEARSIKVRFYGRRLEGIRALSLRYNVEASVEIFPSVPYRESLRLQQASDVLLLLLWDTPEEHGVYTGKLFEYIGAGRPILSIGLDDGVAGAFIKQNMFGVVTSSPDGIAAQLRVWKGQKKEVDGLPQIPIENAAPYTRSAQFQKLLPHLITATVSPLNQHVKQ